MKVWVLTDEHNMYDQYGKYFVAVFAEKPAHQQLTTLGVPQNRLRHVLNGGGRVGDEDHWFHLDVIEPIKVGAGGTATEGHNAELTRRAEGTSSAAKRSES